MNLALLLHTQGKDGEAELLYRDALASAERSFGKNNWQVGVGRMGLGQTLVSLNRFTEAEAVLLEAERVLATAEGVPAAHHKKCVEGLVALYSKWNQSEPGKGYDAKAELWKAKLPTTQPAATPTSRP